MTGLHAYFNDMSCKLQTVDFANDLDASDSYILLKYIVFILENMQMQGYKPHKMYECQMRGFYVIVVGYARGNPYKLLYPTDSSGNICGYDTGYT